jgi:hypothetical protein
VHRPIRTPFFFALNNCILYAEINSADTSFLFFLSGAILVYVEALAAGMRGVVKTEAIAAVGEFHAAFFS